MKLMAVCALFCVFMGCASSNTVQTSKATHLTSLPERNSLIFIGVSGPQLKPEQEVEVAREDAAKKVSMYHGLAASFVSIQGIGTNALDYQSSSGFQMVYDTELDKYKDRLTYDPERDLSYGDGVVYIRFSYPGNFPVNISYTSRKDSDGNPSWIKSPPQDINGFMAQIGFARRQQRIRDTINKSIEDAVTGLITRSSSSVNTGVSSHNDVSSTFITQESSGRLSNFMVLETWVDPENLSVWTLTVARSVN